MVRAPCCEKMGLKRGPWTQEEDAVLVSYIRRHGHGNWRALPKLAGLLRCGKSCRLRWTNYLRPDIKRGNFTEEEEDMIISLHEMLGNRWSAIAARLPGRTDNEIKNVWHTHLKKRLKPAHKSKEEPKKRRTKPESRPKKEVEPENTSFSPAASSDSGFSSSCTDSSLFVIENASHLSNLGNESMDHFTSQELFEIDESFWNEALSMDCTEAPMDAAAEQGGAFSLAGEQLSSDGLCNDEDLNFWLKIFMLSGDLPEL